MNLPTVRVFHVKQAPARDDKPPRMIVVPCGVGVARSVVPSSTDTIDLNLAVKFIEDNFHVNVTGQFDYHGEDYLIAS